MATYPLYLVSYIHQYYTVYIALVENGPWRRVFHMGSSIHPSTLFRQIEVTSIDYIYIDISLYIYI